MKISGIYKIESRIKPKRIYIGSAINIHHRWIEHLSKLKKGNHHSIKLQNHYNKYGKNDLEFSIIIGCEKHDLIITEQFFIDFYKPWFNCSLTAGNLLGYKHSDKSKKNMSGRIPWNKGKKATIEAILNQSKSHLGIISGHKGKPHSKESKKKMSEIKKGRKCSDETKQRMSIAHKNISDETRRKMSNISKERKMSDEFKQKIKDSWIIRKQKNNVNKLLLQTNLN